MAANLILYYATIAGLGEGKDSHHEHAHEEASEKKEPHKPKEQEHHDHHKKEQHHEEHAAVKKEEVKKEEPKKEAAAEEADDFDPFAEVTEEEAGDEAARKESLKAQKPHKDEPVQKSNIVLDVKVKKIKADLAVLEQNVRAIALDGLTWGPSKLVDVAYGVKKLQISAIVINEKVSQDDLEEKIMALPKVQSVDVAAFVRV